jgi:hypothetical protein
LPLEKKNEKERIIGGEKGVPECTPPNDFTTIQTSSLPIPIFSYPSLPYRTHFCLFQTTEPSSNPAHTTGTPSSSLSSPPHHPLSQLFTSLHPHPVKPPTSTTTEDKMKDIGKKDKQIIRKRVKSFSNPKPQNQTP